MRPVNLAAQARRNLVKQKMGAANTGEVLAVLKRAKGDGGSKAPPLPAAPSRENPSACLLRVKVPAVPTPINNGDAFDVEGGGVFVGKTLEPESPGFSVLEAIGPSALFQWHRGVLQKDGQKDVPISIRSAINREGAMLALAERVVWKKLEQATSPASESIVGNSISGNGHVDYFFVPGDLTPFDQAFNIKEPITSKDKFISMVKVIARVADILQGLEVEHGFLQPKNILVQSGTGEVFLAGFGLAQLWKKARQADGFTSLLEKLADSENYFLPPEIAGKQPYSPNKADAFSLGRLLLLLINNGEELFLPNDQTQRATVLRNLFHGAKRGWREDQFSLLTFIAILSRTNKANPKTRWDIKKLSQELRVLCPPDPKTGDGDDEGNIDFGF